jgi:hypothetical protein
VDQNYQMIRLDKGGVLIGMRQISSGHSLNLLPYVTTRTIQSFSEPAESDFDGGLDLKYGLTSDLWLDATLNPDFGQVEIDEEQINLDKRYEIQIEEKRPFFLENTNLFQMPFYQLFYSRRIGFESEIKAGAKVTGKIGEYSLGILEAFTGGWENFGTGDPGKPPTDELFSVFRLQRDIFSSSNLGMMYVNRTANIGSENPEYNHALDLDYSIYSGQKYFTGQGVYTHNSESGATQRGGGVFGQAGYYGRLFWLNIHATSFTEDFNLDHTGFFPKIPNKGSTQAGFYADVHPLVNKKVVRSWGFSITPTVIKDTDESEAGWGVKSTAWLEFPEQSRIKIGYTRYRDVEADNFSNLFGAVKGTELPYSGRDIFAEIQTDIGKPVSFHLRWNDDSQYYFQTHNTGYSTGIEGSVRIKPLPSTLMELGVQNRKFLNDNRELMPTSLVGQSNILILSLRARYLFSRYIFSRLFVQHTNGAEEFQSMNGRVVFPLRYEVWDRLSANVLLGWRFSMGSTLYLAYTEEWEKRFTVNFRSSNRILYLKISYVWSL